MEDAGSSDDINKEIPFEKAKQIAGKVIGNIKAMGQEAELTVLKWFKCLSFRLKARPHNMGLPIYQLTNNHSTFVLYSTLSNLPSRRNANADTSASSVR